jgi:hypothetical protein
MKFHVWTTHVVEDKEPHDELEVTRTVRAVAEQDAAIFRDIFHRKAWVQAEE